MTTSICSQRTEKPSLHLEDGSENEGDVADTSETGATTISYPLLGSTVGSERKRWWWWCCWRRDRPSPPPDDRPLAVQLFRQENVAVPGCYLVSGLMQGLVGPFVNTYPLDLGATEAQQTTIASLIFLPASFKILFGFLSDNVPLWGYRRKSYMYVGWCLTSLSMVVLLLFSNLDTVVETGLLEGAPSIPFLSFVLLISSTGIWFADVMADSVVAEKAKLEPDAFKGQMQSTCYACRFFGLMVAAPCSALAYDRVGPRALVLTMTLLPVVLLPAVRAFAERRDVPVPSTRRQCQEIWNTVCSRSVWQPMGFVYLFNLLQVQNSAWKQYLKTVLVFSDGQINSLLVVSNVMLCAGIMMYKYCFLQWSWRTAYVFTTLLNGFFSILQVLLVQGITLGTPPYWFAMGDNALAAFTSGIQFLPITLMMVHLCPSGSEGASYAMFTTVVNSALNLSSALSTLLLRAWDVSEETLSAGDTKGVLWLTVLTSSLQTSGILFVGLLPRDRQDLEALDDDSGRGDDGHQAGGFVFLTVTLLSVCYSVVVGAWNVLR